jgi:hypothetical protein
VDGNPQDGPAAGQGETLAFNFEPNSQGNTYFKCLAANLHDSDLWHIWGTNNTIDSCEAHSCDNPNYGTGAGAHADVIQCWAGTSKDCTVQNCYFHDIDSQIGITNSQGLPDGSGITWRNNIIAQVASVYFLYMPNARVYNNLFYRCSSTNSWPIWLAPGGQGEGTAGGNSDGVIIRNNAFVACGPGGSGPTEGAINCPTDGGHSTIDHNFLCDAANAGRSIVDWTFYQNTLGSDSVNGGDPAFVSENDFHTKAGSALRGKGVAISPAFPDRDGKARSGAWDIGPYQS